VIPVLVDNPAVGHADTGVGVADTGVANAGTGGGQTTTGGTGGGHTATGGGHTATGGGHAATASRALGPPPASVDFVSQVWNNFGATVLPLCGGVAQEAVRTNRDPLEIGEHDSVLLYRAQYVSTVYYTIHYLIFLKGHLTDMFSLKSAQKCFFPLFRYFFQI